MRTTMTRQVVTKTLLIADDILLPAFSHQHQPAMGSQSNSPKYNRSAQNRAHSCVPETGALFIYLFF